jgi:hypothetical protein
VFRSGSPDALRNKPRARARIVADSFASFAGGLTVPQVHYGVDCQDGVWWVSLNDKRFGPYSSLDTAMAAASGAAHKAEAQGYEAFVTINTPAESAEEPAGQDQDAA